MSIKEEKTGSFQAVAGDGSTHTISLYTSFTRATFLSGESQRVPGLKRYALDNGNHLNANEDGTFEDVRTGMTLRRT
jgi:hypothetical protein